MDSKILMDLKGNFEEALSEIAQKKDFTPRDLEHATKLLCAIEKIKTLDEDTGYSGHPPQEKMIRKLKSMMGEAENEQERRTVQEWISRLER